MQKRGKGLASSYDDDGGMGTIEATEGEARQGRGHAGARHAGARGGGARDRAGGRWGRAAPLVEAELDGRSGLVGRV